MEQKLDIPGVGRWASKSVFSIPLDPNSGPSIVESPGLILIERTPLGDVEDPIEWFAFIRISISSVLCMCIFVRKYRVLDDCARLRDIVDALRSNLKRLRYLPILLVVSWSESEVDDEFLDFAEMVRDGELLIPPSLKLRPA